MGTKLKPDAIKTPDSTKLINTMSKTKATISDLSPHLFWDVNRDSLNFNENSKLIIHRVLEYGLETDWIIILNYYGMEKIAETALFLKDLDEKSLSFISVLADIPKEKFLCYTTRRSTPKHWNF